VGCSFFSLSAGAFFCQWRFCDHGQRLRALVARESQLVSFCPSFIVSSSQRHWTYLVTGWIGFFREFFLWQSLLSATPRLLRVSLPVLTVDLWTHQP
jgi:hypothetical protein